MEVVETGHIYRLKQLDGNREPQYLTFVNREDGREHPGTQSQEVLRVAIDLLDVIVDRTNHLDEATEWRGNHDILKELTEAQRRIRRALLFYEFHNLERHIDREGFKPEQLPMNDAGHFDLKIMKSDSMSLCVHIYYRKRDKDRNNEMGTFVEKFTNVIAIREEYGELRLKIFDRQQREFLAMKTFSDTIANWYPDNDEDITWAIIDQNRIEKLETYVE